MATAVVLAAAVANLVAVAVLAAAVVAVLAVAAVVVMAVVVVELRFAVAAPTAAEPHQQARGLNQPVRGLERHEPPRRPRAPPWWHVTAGTWTPNYADAFPGDDAPVVMATPGPPVWRQSPLFPGVRSLGRPGKASRIAVVLHLASRRRVCPAPLSSVGISHRNSSTRPRRVHNDASPPHNPAGHPGPLSVSRASARFPRSTTTREALEV